MDVNVFAPVDLQLASASTTTQGVACTPWVPSCGLTEGKWLIEVVDTSIDSTVDIYPAVQFATSEVSAPDAWIQKTTKIGSGSITAATDEGDKICSGMVDISPSSTKFWVRFGVTIENTSGTLWRTANVRVRVTAKEA